MAERLSLEQVLGRLFIDSSDEYDLNEGDSSEEEGNKVAAYSGGKNLQEEELTRLSSQVGGKASRLPDSGDESEISMLVRNEESMEEYISDHSCADDNFSQSSTLSMDFSPRTLSNSSSESSDEFDCVQPRARRAKQSSWGRTRGSSRGRSSVERGRSLGRGRQSGRSRISRRGRSSGESGGSGRGRSSRRSRASGRGRNSGRGTGSQTVSNATPSILDPITDLVWEKKEPNSFSRVYTLTPGPTTPVDSSMSALELFSRFFVDEVWDLMVTETNRLAASSVANTPHARPWHDTSIPEMKAFVGILILMGIIKLPRIELYWSVNHPYLGTPGISNIMSRVRFEQIFRFLHLCNNAAQVPYGLPGYDKLFKVRKFFDLITAKFESQYTIHQQCTIDEAMIPFKGRLGFKQYIKNKPTKWGIKVFVLADASVCYVKRLQIYSGKEGDNSRTQVGLCSKVVLDLVAGFEDTGLELYTDNFYTSPVLYHHLYRRGINACGTVRSDRLGYPKSLITPYKKALKGYIDYRSSGPLLACVWLEKRTVYFLSTIHVAETTPPCTVKRIQQDGTYDDVNCPSCVPDYQRYMGGVDDVDQMMSYYNVGRRSKKWWKKVFSYGLECCISNAYVLDGHARPQDHSRKGRSKRDYFTFRYELASDLIGGFQSRQHPGRKRSDEHMQLERLNTSLGHWPEQVSLKRNCVVCQSIILKKQLSSVGHRHESRIRCKYCQVHLCVTKERNCFEKFHTLVNYS